MTSLPGWDAHKDGEHTVGIVPQSAAERGPDTLLDRAANIARSALALAVFMTLAGFALVGLSQITGDWQHVAVAGVAFVGAAVFAGLRWWALGRGVVSKAIGRGLSRLRPSRPGTKTGPQEWSRAQRERVAAVLMSVTMLLLGGVVSLFWGGTALMLAATTAVTAGILVAVMVAPGARGWLWGATLLVGAAIWLLGDVPLPWKRYDIDSMPLTATGLRVLMGGIMLVGLWLLGRATTRIRALGARLAIAFIALALAVALAVSVTSIALGVRSVQTQVFEQLRTSVVLKAQAVVTWVNQIKFVMETMVVEDYEVQRAQALLLESLTEDFRITSKQNLRVRFNSVIDRTQWFTEIFLITTSGEVVLSTTPRLEGRSVAGEAYFREGLSEAYLAPPEYDPVTGEIAIVFVRPLQLGRTTYGILAARADMGQLKEIVTSGAMGETGASHLVGPDFLLLTEPVMAGGFLPAHSEAIDAALEDHVVLGQSTYMNHTGTEVLGVYTWLPELEVALVSEMAREEVLAGARLTSYVSAGVAAVAALLAVLAGILFARGLSRPLVRLAATAAQVAARASSGARLDLGITGLQVDMVREDEVGALARAFGAMTDQLRALIEGLEARVEERTRGLQAVTEVSRATTSVLDPEELLPQVVTLVRERFELYYVGLFLLEGGEDDASADAAGATGRAAVLRAGTGEAGEAMLAQGWRLPVDETSMIGRCIVRGEAVVLQDTVSEEGSADRTPVDATRLRNPLLPDTRSEMALPLRYGDRVVGAMTVQSERVAAFDETSTAVLQNLADQVAVAVQNAALFAETEAALARAVRIQERYQSQAWSTYLRSRPVLGYEMRGGEVTPIATVGGEEGTASNGLGLDQQRARVQNGVLQVPIVQGGEVIGVLGVERSEIGYNIESDHQPKTTGHGADTDIYGIETWTDAEKTLIEGLAEQLALAAENQRLLDETQRREAAERLTREVTARMREPVEMADVLRTAAEEIRQAFGSDWVTVRLVDSTPEGGSEGGGDGV